MQKQERLTNIYLYMLFFLRSIAQFLHKFTRIVCQFISWTNWVNSGRFMNNYWISCQVMANMKKVYDDLIIINQYPKLFIFVIFQARICSSGHSRWSWGSLRWCGYGHSTTWSNIWWVLKILNYFKRQSSSSSCKVEIV